MASHPKRYLGNIDTKEVHDTWNEQTNCQLNEIKDKVYFDTLEQAHRAGYDNCYWCLGGSKR